MAERLSGCFLRSANLQRTPRGHPVWRAKLGCAFLAGRQTTTSFAPVGPQIKGSGVRCVTCNIFGRKKSGGTSSDFENERSSLVNEESVLFLFQLQLDSEMQRAMNYEIYDAARELRTKRDQVDSAVASLQEMKGAGAGAKGSAQAEVVDVTTEGLQIRMELQKAVDEERYQDAARLRDQLIELENQSKTAEASVEEVSVDPLFTLGQRVTHKSKKYKGVICGWDILCCESDVWKEKNKVDKLEFGVEQPYYHLLVDEREWRPSAEAPPVAYVAEENLTAPSVEGSTWVQTHGRDALQHPYLTWMFLGPDAAGDMIPCSQLRNKYSLERWDVYPPGDEDDEDEDEDDGDSTDS